MAAFGLIYCYNDVLKVSDDLIRTLIRKGFDALSLPKHSSELTNQISS